MSTTCMSCDPLRQALRGHAQVTCKRRRWCRSETTIVETLTNWKRSNNRLLRGPLTYVSAFVTELCLQKTKALNLHHLGWPFVGRPKRICMHRVPGASRCVPLWLHNLRRIKHASPRRNVGQTYPAGVDTCCTTFQSAAVLGCMVRRTVVRHCG